MKNGFCIIQVKEMTPISCIDGNLLIYFPNVLYSTVISYFAIVTIMYHRTLLYLWSWTDLYVCCFESKFILLFIAFLLFAMYLICSDKCVFLLLDLLWSLYASTLKYIYTYISELLLLFINLTEMEFVKVVSTSGLNLTTIEDCLIKKNTVRSKIMKDSLNWPKHF